MLLAILRRAKPSRSKMAPVIRIEDFQFHTFSLVQSGDRIFERVITFRNLENGMSIWIAGRSLVFLPASETNDLPSKVFFGAKVVVIHAQGMKGVVRNKRKKREIANFLLDQYLPMIQ